MCAFNKKVVFSDGNRVRTQNTSKFLCAYGYAATFGLWIFLRSNIPKIYEVLMDKPVKLRTQFLYAIPN